MRRMLIAAAVVAALATVPAAHAQQTETYFYDVHGRLTAVTKNGGTSGGTSFYQLDSGDNRTSREVLTFAAPATGDRLVEGERLAPGQSLRSADNRFSMTLQRDGDLVLSFGTTILWRTGTANGAAAVLVMQGDGNLVMYTPSYVPVWNSGTNGYSGARLIVQTDGNLVIYSGSTAVWQSGTCCH